MKGNGLKTPALGNSFQADVKLGGRAIFINFFEKENWSRRRESGEIDMG